MTAAGPDLRADGAPRPHRDPEGGELRAVVVSEDDDGLEPVPVPRLVFERYRTLPHVRGLHGLLERGGGTDDLSIGGVAARGAAWELTVTAISEALAVRGMQFAWSPEGASTPVLTLADVTLDAARDVILDVLARLEQEQGVVVGRAEFASANRLHGGTVIIESTVTIRPADGADGPLAWFESERARAYVRLLAAQNRPFRAHEWVFLPRGAIREGFRLHDSGTEPSAGGSLYGIGLDLVLCLVETWHRQRDAWFLGEVVLRDGSRVNLGATRLVRVDSDDVLLRLDPRRRWGRNRRGRLGRCLRALAALERRVVGIDGQVLESGDRVLHRVIDGRWRREEVDALETADPEATAAVLARAGAIPSDDFFVEVSPDLIRRLVAVERDVDGSPAWGVRAAEAAQRVVLLAHPDDRTGARRRAAEVRRDARARPYVHHSPRLLTLGNAEGWSVHRRKLALQLLQERTPGTVGRRTRRASRTADSTAAGSADPGAEGYVACNGRGGHGYRLVVWLEKIGYRRDVGDHPSRGAVLAFAGDVEILMATLGVRVEASIGDRRCAGEAAVRMVRNVAGARSAIRLVKLRFYSPADLEVRLRARLAEHGIVRAPDASASPSAVLAGAELRLRRVECAMTQETLARRLGVSAAFVSMVESGRKVVPDNRRASWLGALSGLAPNLDVTGSASELTSRSPGPGVG